MFGCFARARPRRPSIAHGDIMVANESPVVRLTLTRCIQEILKYHSPWKFEHTEVRSSLSRFAVVIALCGLSNEEIWGHGIEFKSL